MKARKRSRIEICMDILDIARQPVKRTKLATKARIDYAKLRYYTELLERHGLLTSIYLRYRTTAKGFDILQTWSTVKKLLGDLDV